MSIDAEWEQWNKRRTTIDLWFQYIQIESVVGKSLVAFLLQFICWFFYVCAASRHSSHAIQFVIFWELILKIQTKKRNEMKTEKRQKEIFLLHFFFLQSVTKNIWDFFMVFITNFPYLIGDKGFVCVCEFFFPCLLLLSVFGNEWCRWEIVSWKHQIHCL